MTPDQFTPFTRAAHTLLHFETAVQYLGIVLSVIGVGCSIYAIVEFLKQSTVLTGVQRIVAQSSLVGQGAVLFCQLTMMTINILVITLPEIPMIMYIDSDSGAWIVLVILARKILRNLMIVVLAFSSVHRVWTFHRLLSHLRAAPIEGHSYQHRRMTDP